MLKSIYFELHQKEEAFKAFKEQEQLYIPYVRLVVSYHTYSDGYWIEFAESKTDFGPLDISTDSIIEELTPDRYRNKKIKGIIE